MKLITNNTYTGKENMQIDSDLLESAINNNAKEPVFRLYSWFPKCVSLGRNQNQDENLTKECERLGVDIVRRVTGGRALLHDNEITYSCVIPVEKIPNGEKISESYKYISGILIDFFKTIGVELNYGDNKKFSAKYDYCMLISTGADVCYDNKKIIGSAQFRKNGYILQHGSILYDYDKNLLESLFHEEVNGITCVKEVLPDLTKEELANKLENYIKGLEL